MRASARFVVFVGAALIVGVLGSVAARANEPGEAELAETIVIDEEPEAFFAYASRAMAEKMGRALSSACSNVPAQSALCSGTPLSFLRAVSVYGIKQQYGFACTKDSLYVRNKYFTPDEIRSSNHCVFVDCTFRTGLCEVDPFQLAKKES